MLHLDKNRVKHLQICREGLNRKDKMLKQKGKTGQAGVGGTSMAGRKFFSTWASPSIQVPV
jgi:hypothetical protein